MAKQIFKTETTKIRNISFVLKMHQKTNGTQVILSKENAAKIEQINALLNNAANLLETIN